MSELKTARTPELIATEINTIKDQTRKIMLANSIEIGRRLTEAKELVPHGEWGNWLEKSVDYSKSTANNLMRIFEEYGAEQITLLDDNVKSEILGKLSYSQAVALLGLPEEERETFVEENNVEEMSTRELQQAIKDRDEALKAKKESEDRLKQVEKEKNENKKEILKLEESLKIKQRAYQSLLDSNDTERIEAMQESMKTLDDELAEVRRKNAELEKQLKEIPIEVPQVIEKIPEEVTKELEELRKKASQTPNVDKAVDKFKANFEIVKTGFNGMLCALAEIEDKKKYKEATIKYLNILLEKAKDT